MMITMMGIVIQLASVIFVFPDIAGPNTDYERRKCSLDEHC